MLQDDDWTLTSTPIATDSPKDIGFKYPILATMADMSKLGLIVFDVDQKMEHFNAVAASMFGVNLAEIKGDLSYSRFVRLLANKGAFGEEDPSATVAFIKDTLKNQLAVSKSQMAELDITTPDGRFLHIRQNVAQGRCILTVEDTTQTRNNTQILEIALESGEAGYWHFNPETKELDIVSDYFEHCLTPRQMERARTDGILSIVHPDDFEKTKAVWLNALELGKPWKHTCRILKGNGDSIWVKMNVKPQLAKDKTVAGFTCFFKDVTQDLVNSDSLRRAKEGAEKSLKVQNDFLGRLAHEIRTPMNGVIGIADALIHHNADKSLTPKLELIQSSADKILRIVDETLSHTKLNADKLTLDAKLANPAKSVENIMRLWEHKALKSKIDLTSHIDKSVPDEIKFDHFRYEQCINNLLSNALKFSPNGTVEVIMTTHEPDSDNPKLILAVKDNGIGMTSEQQKQVFEAYAQADKSITRRFGGTGLGTTITKEIIEKMGGTISVRSKLGEGTIFILTLPYGAKKADTENPKHESGALVEQMLEDAKPEPSKYAHLKVLVVDDNSTNHVVIKSLLESMVAEIHLAGNGQEAIDTLRTTDIDIVLMDIHMPIMDGIEATLTIRGADELWSDIIIIALTADPQYQQKRLCRNIGMDEALAKPVKLSDVLTAFDTVLKIDNAAVKAA